MNGLQNSSPNDPRKRNPFNWVAEQSTHLHAVSFVPLTILLLQFEMLYIGSGFFTSFVVFFDWGPGWEWEMEPEDGYISIQKQLELRAHLFFFFLSTFVSSVLLPDTCPARMKH